MTLLFIPQTFKIRLTQLGRWSPILRRRTLLFPGRLLFLFPMAATPQIDTPYPSHSRSSSLSRVVSPEQVTPKPKSEENVELSVNPTTTSIPIHHRRYYYFHPALVLQNSGSVARDHLASERTFLAYTRTSLGLASAGVAFVQLFTMSDRSKPTPAINRFATPLGLSTLGMALIVLIIGEFGTLLFLFIELVLPIYFFKRCF